MQASSFGKGAKKGKGDRGVGFLLLMDVELNAPVINIPRSSDSQDALEVDLGTFTLSNQIAWFGGEGSVSDRKVPFNLRPAPLDCDTCHQLSNGGPRWEADALVPDRCLGLSNGFEFRRTIPSQVPC